MDICARIFGPLTRDVPVDQARPVQLIRVHAAASAGCQAVDRRCGYTRKSPCGRHRVRQCRRSVRLVPETNQDRRAGQSLVLIQIIAEKCVVPVRRAGEQHAKDRLPVIQFLSGRRVCNNPPRRPIMQFSEVRRFVPVPVALECLHQPEHPRQALLAVASVSRVAGCIDPVFADFDIPFPALPGHPVLRRPIKELLEGAPGLLEKFHRAGFVSSVERISAANKQIQAGADHPQGGIDRVVPAANRVWIPPEHGLPIQIYSFWYIVGRIRSKVLSAGNVSTDRSRAIRHAEEYRCPVRRPVQRAPRRFPRTGA